MALPDWHRAHGGVAAQGIIRTRPEDFFVEEIPRVRPSGDGSHLWLWAEKCGANTEWVAGQLARVAGCSVRDVGYAGMKDRHAVTQQWFSLPNPGGLPDFGSIEGVTVLEMARHEKKLKRGTLAGNRFRLVIRDVVGCMSELTGRLKNCRDLGVPNYFGPQRFGRSGANIAAAQAWIGRPRKLPRARRARHISVLRSAAFNDLLSERVSLGSWNRLLPGEQAMLDGTHSLIHCDPLDERLQQRCLEHDVHPSGPLTGEQGAAPTGEALRVEEAVMAQWADVSTGLAGQRVQAGRRSLVVVPKNLEWDSSGDTVKLSFELPAGAYATALLRELLDFREAQRDTSAPTSADHQTMGS